MLLVYNTQDSVGCRYKVLYSFFGRETTHEEILGLLPAKFNHLDCGSVLELRVACYWGPVIPGTIKVTLVVIERPPISNH